MTSLHQAITANYYETTAARGARVTKAHYEDAAARLERRLRPFLPRDTAARCLDLACGLGEVVYLYEKLGFRDARGVDLCKEEIEIARSFVSRDLVYQDAIAFLRDQPPASVDFITALNFLEHLDKDTLHELLRECRRVLAPNGRLVAMVPNAAAPYGSLTRHWDMTHEWAFTTNNFRQLAPLTGFSPQIRFRECGPVPYGLTSGIRWLLWQGIRAGIAFRHLVELGTAKEGIYTMDMMVELRAPEEQMP